MSALIQRHAIDLLWKQWTAAGVAGNARPPQQAIDLEALIAFTPYVAAADPRLGDECTDWCVRIGKRFISISRLRQISRLMPPRSQEGVLDLPSALIAKVDISDLRLSKKSRAPSLELPCLVQLRSRYIFVVGARADILARLVMRERAAGAQRAAAISPTGYTKQAVANVLDELWQAGVLKRLVRSKSVSYEVSKEAPLRSLLAPLPKRMPSWVERFVIVANILEAWRRFGKRATYSIELAKVLDQIRPIISAAGELAPSTGKPPELLARIERWAISLLDDNVWEDLWLFDEQDITHEILQALQDRLVETVHSGEYAVGYTELGTLSFRNIDGKIGTSEFTVQFSAEHPTSELSFDGHVEGTFRFDPDAKDKEEFLKSLEVTEAHEHFDMEDPDDGGG
jgi:hypothetical protein